MVHVEPDGSGAYPTIQAAVDAAACAGIHVASTGEVGLIKYDGLEKIRGRLRLHWLIGERAYRDNREKDRLIAALNRELTCGTSEMAKWWMPNRWS